ncbi:hypothetical protein D9611_004358 [Ephemerocybe angulata]|uniref:NYN domain-containing protein n=1 Tax=Ephemerocybe angulata TaxID=980116 RepID=A0A8H5BKH3_9AGAR|nr:hypothetical protein D9611_004358 [Tulosesus angulatus]
MEDEHCSVSVLWDASAKPEPGLSGFEVVNAIRAGADRMGTVKSLKLYLDISGDDAPSPAFRFQLQCAGVTLVDTASSGRIGSATKMILVDAFCHAFDETSTHHAMLIISADPDICYGVSLLRARGFQTYILSPGNSHCSLFEFHLDGEVDTTMLQDEADQWRSEVPHPIARSRRASFRAPSPRQYCDDRSPTAPSDALPSSTIQAFRDEFAANVSLVGPGAAGAPKGASLSPTTRTPSPGSPRSQSSLSSTSGDDQVYQTPKARVEEEEEDYVAVTPPKDKGKGVDRDSFDGPRSRARSMTFSTPPGFYFIPNSLGTAPSVPSPRPGDRSGFTNSRSASVLGRNATLPFVAPSSLGAMPSLLSPHPGDRISFTNSRSSSVLGRNAGIPPGTPQPIGLEKVPSTASNITVKPSATTSNGPVPVPISTKKLLEPTPLSFSPPPPLSPARTRSMSAPDFPLTPPASIAASTTSTAFQDSSTPSGKGGPAPTSFSFGATATPAAGSKPLPQTSSRMSPPPPKLVLPQLKEPSNPALAFKPSTLRASAPSFPTPSTSVSSTAGPTGIIKPTPVVAVASHFVTLVDYMRESRGQGNEQVNRMHLGAVLVKRQPDIYIQAGVSGTKAFKKYIEQAVNEGIITANSTYVSLHPKYH